MERVGVFLSFFTYCVRRMHGYFCPVWCGHQREGYGFAQVLRCLLLQLPTFHHGCVKSINRSLVVGIAPGAAVTGPVWGFLPTITRTRDELQGVQTRSSRSVRYFCGLGLDLLPGSKRQVLSPERWSASEAGIQAYRRQVSCCIPVHRRQGTSCAVE